MRAASHVDWVISIGIFLIYILAVFIFLRPGVEPVYKKDVLTNIVKENINKDVYYTIKKTPIFINLTNADTGTYKLFIGFDSENEFPFTGEDINFAMINSSNDILRFGLSGEGINKRLRFDSYVEINRLNVFYLLYSEEIRYDTDNPQEEVEIRDGENFTYSFGVTTGIKGISIDNLTNLNQDYDALKTSWGFPKNKDFLIYLANTSKLQYTQEDIIFSYDKSEQFEQADVFVREWQDFILNKNGQRDPVIMNIRTW